MGMKFLRFLVWIKCVLELFYLQLSFWVLITNPLVGFEPLVRLNPLGNTDEQAQASNSNDTSSSPFLFSLWNMWGVLAVWLAIGVFSIFFFILFISLCELVCIELKFKALVLVHFKLVATLLVDLTAHCRHRFEEIVKFIAFKIFRI